MADFMDAIGQHISNQWDQATDFGNLTPKTTTINHNADGTQDITHKFTTAPVNPAEQPTAPQPQMPAPMPAPAPVAQAPAPVAPVAPQPTMTPATMTAPPVNAPRPIMNDQGQVLGHETPQQMVQGAQTNAPIQQAPQPVAPVAPSMTPVAAPAQQPAPVQQAPAQQPAPAPTPAPDWSLQLQTAGNDPTKLFSIAGNADYPEEVRRAAAEKAYNVGLSEKKQQQDKELVQRMLQGDVKAQNTVMRDIRKDSAEGSYIKAILFSAMGLHDLSKNEQQKLGVNTFGQAILDGGHYTVEKNGQGAVTRAWDSTGKAVGDDTLAKMNAMATAQGSHQYGFAGGIHVIPGTNEQVIPRTNTMTGQTEFVHMTGPNANKIYTGNVMPIPQAIPTAAAKATNAANIAISAAGPKAANAVIGKFGAEHGGATGGGGVANPMPTGGVIAGSAPATIAPAGPVAPPTIAQPVPAAKPAIAPVNPNAPVAAPARTPTVLPPREAPTTPANAIPPYDPAIHGTRAQYENMIKAQGEGQKIIARKAGEVVATAPEIEGQIKDINTAITILDSGKHNIGPGLSALQGRGPVAQAIGGQLETVDQKNTNMVMDTVNKMAATGLKSLGSNPSTADLKFWTENKPKSNSNPEFVKMWIENAKTKLERSLEYNKAQVGAGVGRNTETTTPDTSGIKIIKREKIQ